MIPVVSWLEKAYTFIYYEPLYFEVNFFLCHHPDGKLVIVCRHLREHEFSQLYMSTTLIWQLLQNKCSS